MFSVNKEAVREDARKLSVIIIAAGMIGSFIEGEATAGILLALIGAAIWMLTSVRRT